MTTLLTRLKTRLDEWLMYRRGAEDVTIEMDGEEFTIPVAPLDWDQQLRVQRAQTLLNPGGMPRPGQAGVAIDTLINVTNEVTPVTLDAGSLDGETMDQLLAEAPRQGIEGGL